MKTEPFCLIEKLQGPSGEPFEWLIGEDDKGKEKWTSNFHEVPDAWKFPTKWHAQVIMTEFKKGRGEFLETGYRTFAVTEHLMLVEIKEAKGDE